MNGFVHGVGASGSSGVYGESDSGGCGKTVIWYGACGLGGGSGGGVGDYGPKRAPPSFEVPVGIDRVYLDVRIPDPGVVDYD
jgi:hypothetical protein